MQGDTNSALAGALVANKLKIPLVHVEAGFHSHLKIQPEEMNRILVDQMSNFNIASDAEAISNLKSDGLKQNIYDCLTQLISANHMLKELDKVTQLFILLD